MTEDTDLQPEAAEYLALADLLASIAEAEWDCPSLCDGWRVREVVAHLTMPARYGNAEFMTELEAHGFDHPAPTGTRSVWRRLPGDEEVPPPRCGRLAPYASW